MAATFGANVEALFPTDAPIPADAQAVLAALRATGATVARTDTVWETAEPQPPVDGVHSYDWQYDDGVASTLAGAGLTWHAVLDYATTWAADAGAGVNPGVAPSYMPDFVAYAAAFAARYGAGGSFWAEHPALAPKPVRVFEIWNEPDLPMFWGPVPNLGEFSSMYLLARAAIKQVDPSATVIIGGLVWPANDLPAMLAAQPALKGNVDGLGVHAYVDTGDGTLGVIDTDLGADLGTLAVPIYVDEFGWEPDPSSWQGATEPNRDAYIEEVTEQLGIDRLVADVEPYCWVCGGPFDMYDTPAAAAFARGIAVAELPRSQPAVATTTASAPALTSATINGEVDPENLPTDYHFEYGTTAAYGLSAPAPDGSLGSDQDSAGHAVAQALSGLKPGTTYHFRLVASNGYGTTTGQDQIFATRPDISGLRLAPARFRVTPTGSDVAKARGEGTVVHFHLAEPSAVTFTVERVDGRRRTRCRGAAVRACRPPVGRRWTFSHTARSGDDRFDFTGRMASGALAPGRYRLAATRLASFGPVATPIWVPFAIRR